MLQMVLKHTSFIACGNEMQIRSPVSAIYVYSNKNSIQTNGGAYIANTEHVVHEFMIAKLQYQNCYIFERTNYYPKRLQTPHK